MHNAEHSGKHQDSNNGQQLFLPQLSLPEPTMALENIQHHFLHPILMMHENIVFIIMPIFRTNVCHPNCTAFGGPSREIPLSIDRRFPRLAHMGKRSMQGYSVSIHTTIQIITTVTRATKHEPCAPDHVHGRWCPSRPVANSMTIVRDLRESDSYFKFQSSHLSSASDHKTILIRKCSVCCSQTDLFVVNFCGQFAAMISWISIS